MQSLYSGSAPQWKWHSPAFGSYLLPPYSMTFPVLCTCTCRYTTLGGADASAIALIASLNEDEDLWVQRNCVAEECDSTAIDGGFYNFVWATSGAFDI